MEAKLIVVGGDAKATEIKLKLPTIIGRGRGATLTLPHPLVSRQHCEIYESNGQLFVRDMGSLNGTFVGNEPITEAPLPPGELLTVGAVTFRAIYGELLEQEERQQKEKEASRSRRAAPTKTIRDAAVETVSEPSAGTVKDDRQLKFPPLAGRPPAKKAELAPAETIRAPQEKSPPAAAAEGAASLKLDLSADNGAPAGGEAWVDEEALVDEAALTDEVVEVVEFEDVMEEAEAPARPASLQAAAQDEDIVDEVAEVEDEVDPPTTRTSAAVSSALGAESLNDVADAEVEVEAIDEGEDLVMVEEEAIEVEPLDDEAEVLDRNEVALVEGSTTGSMDLATPQAADASDKPAVAPAPAPMAIPARPANMPPVAQPVNNNAPAVQPPMAVPAAPPAATPPIAPPTNDNGAPASGNATDRRWKFAGPKPSAPPAAPFVPPPTATPETPPAQNAADDELQAFLRNLK